MTKDFNGFQYILTETEKGFGVFEQTENYTCHLRTTNTEECNSGWVTFIRFANRDIRESMPCIALTREGSLDKAYFTLKEEFSKYDLIDKTSRAQENELEESCRVNNIEQETPPWVD